MNQAGGSNPNAISDHLNPSIPVTLPPALESASQQEPAKASLPVDSRTTDDNGESPESEASHLAAVLDLLIQTELSDSGAGAANHIASLLQKYLEADRVLIGWCNPRRSRFQRQATESDGLKTSPTFASPPDLLGDQAGDDYHVIDTGAKLLAEGNAVSHDVALQHAADESMLRGPLTQWSRLHGSDGQHAMLAVERYCQRFAVERWEAVPMWVDEELALSDVPTDEPVGVIVVIDGHSRRSNKASQRAAFLSLVATPVAMRMLGVVSRREGRWERMMRALQNWGRQRRLLWIGLAVSLTAAILAVPLPYRVSAICEATPETSRLIAAPFDGFLESIQVRPGDAVSQDQVLVRLDPREIQWELAGIEAQLQQSRQQQKGSLAKQDIAESTLAALEVERLQTRADLLRHQQQNVEVRSPLAGIVVSGDLTRQEGAPVSTGQKLMEVGILGRIVMEIALPEDDAMVVQPGMEVTIRMIALDGQRFQGTIESIDPSAVIREQENVFLARVLIEDPAQILRPGMRGTATVSTPNRPFAWILFHKPWAALLRYLGV